MIVFKKNIRIVCIITVILMIFCLSGCTEQTSTGSIKPSGSLNVTTPEAIASSSEPVLVGMERVVSDDFFYYYRDVTTDVMYVLYCGVNEGGLTVMMDPYTNGPLTHANWLKYQSE